MCVRACVRVCLFARYVCVCMRDVSVRVHVLSVVDSNNTWNNTLCVPKIVVLSLQNNRSINPYYFEVIKLPKHLTFESLQAALMLKVQLIR